MTKEKWVEIWDDKESFKLTDIYGLNFLDYELIESSVKTNEVEILGVDGVMVGANTLEPFDIVLNFFFDGADKHDLNLFAEKLRKKLRRRDPFYLRHSYLPEIKYAINSVEIKHEKLNHSDAEITMTFHCYNGYSESLYDTDQFSLIDGKWQFESGLVPDNTISYKHNRSLFDIYNGSHDTIDPRHGHRLKIRVRLATETGFKLVNKATGDIFEYKGSLKANQSFVLDGGYAYKDQSRCGRQTNHGIIRLAPGYNTFEVWGKISNFEIEFVFPFIYR